VPKIDLFAKTEVNGRNQNPIFKFLKSRCSLSTRQTFRPLDKLFYSPLHNSDIRWNFEKFLINAEGQPLLRYDSKLDPALLIPHIDALLGIESETIEVGHLGDGEGQFDEGEGHEEEEPEPDPECGC